MAKTTDITQAFELDDQRSYSGRGYVDAKMQPVETVEDLNAENFPMVQRFLGLTVTVLNKDPETNEVNPVDYWLKDSIRKWVIKDPNDEYTNRIKTEILNDIQPGGSNIEITGDDVLSSMP